MATGAPEIRASTHDFLRALASDTRQQILQLFAGGIELTVGEVADRAGLGQSTASEQLAVLRRGGLLRATRDGKAVRYRVDAARISTELDQLKSYLTVCCGRGE